MARGDYLANHSERKRLTAMTRRARDSAALFGVREVSVEQAERDLLREIQGGGRPGGYGKGDPRPGPRKVDVPERIGLPRMF